MADRLTATTVAQDEEYRTSSTVLARRFLFAPPSYAARYSKKTTPHPDLRQMLRQWMAGFITIRLGARTNERKKYKEAERRQTCSQLLHPPAQRALCKARSPVGVPLWLLPEGQLVPKALRQATLRVTVRSARSGTAAPTGGRRPCAVPRALPAPSCHRPVSTSHTGRYAGRLMPDAARVQKGRTPCPRAPHPLPPAIRHRLASLYGERVGGF
jgi:hypothetical protein